MKRSHSDPSKWRTAIIGSPRLVNNAGDDDLQKKALGNASRRKEERLIFLLAVYFTHLLLELCQFRAVKNDYFSNDDVGRKICRLF